MRARTKLVIAVQTTVTVALVWTALAWTEERDEARSRYEVAYAEWLAVSEALGRVPAPDVDRMRLAEEEVARCEAAMVRHGEAIAMRDEHRRLVDARAAHIREVSARCQELGRRVEEPLDPDIREREVAAKLRDEAVALRDQARENVKETEEEISTADERLSRLKAFQNYHAVEIEKLESLLDGARRREVPVEIIARDWGRGNRRRVEGLVQRIDAVLSTVTIDLGVGDGVYEHQQLAVFRRGLYLCEVLIMSVAKDASTATIRMMTMMPGCAPRPGDRVRNSD